MQGLMPARDGSRESPA